MSIPANPVMVTVCTVEGDGEQLERANLLADASQIPSLLAPEPNPVRDHTLAYLAGALALPADAALRLSRAAVPAPIIFALTAA